MILAAHGLTANHLHFQALAEQLGEEATLLAPDLRGRGRSRAVAGPTSMAAHADDLAAILDHQGLEQATLVGHSMGAFAIVVTAHRHADRVRDLVLVDGGLPFDIGHLAGVGLPDLVRAIVGPALDRLRMNFPSREAYLDYWRPHPALAADWNRYIEAAYTYDVVGKAPHFHSSVREDAVLEDSASHLRSGDIEASIAQLTKPVVLLRAPRGLFNQVPALYPDASLAVLREALPQLADAVISDVNHYTILLSERGATAVARHIRQRPAA